MAKNADREATNEPYETACRSRVLTPLGVKDARLDPSWRVLSSYGGWFMSGSDYLRFFEIFAPEHRLLSREIRAWQADRTGKVMNPPAKHWYGLGVRIDPATSGQAIISHTGAWPWTQPVSKDGSLAASTGAFVARYPDGTSLFTAFWPIPRDVAERDVAYNKLVDAMRGANERAQGSRAAH